MASLEDTVTFTHRPCPTCRSHGGRREIFSIPAAESAEWGDLQQSWAGFFKTKLFFSYTRCERCGLLYCPVYFDDAQLGQLYARMADNTAGLGAGQMTTTQAGYVSLIGKKDCTGDFLELGPDIGLFTAAHARRFDPQARRKYWLYEPNVDVHQELHRRMEGYDVAVRTTPADLSEIPDNSLGTVVMVHVLDHLLQPADVLANLHRKMRHGAWIHIITHNEGSLLARSLGRRWPAFCLQHPQLFRPGTISGLLERGGFQVAAVDRTTNYFPAAYLVRHGLYALGLNLPFLARLRSFPVGLKLGNMLTSAQARK